jgi:hypothetical protein
MDVSFLVAGPVLAIDAGGGASGFVVVVLLCAAAVGLFVAMSASLRRMRANVARGEFGRRPPPARDPGQPDSGQPDPGQPDPGQTGGGQTGGGRIPPQR